MNESLETHFKPKQSTIAAKAKFFAAVKSPDESLREWAARLRNLASSCDFGAALETNLTDRFILGLGPGHEHDKLFEQDTSTSTLAHALELAEDAALEAKAAVVKEELTFGATVMNAGSARDAVGGQQATEVTACSVCGLKNHKESQCRYKSYKCHKCGNKGHLQKVCDGGEGDGNINNILEMVDCVNNADDVESANEEYRMLHLRRSTSSSSCQTCCCIRIETAGYLFAIINAIGITTGTLFSLGFFGMMLRDRLDPEMRKQETNSFFTILSFVCVVVTLIAEVFAVLLCVGISKKKPGFVMTYLVFGITVEILSVTGLVSLIWISWGRWDLVIYSATLLGLCGIYALPLLLVKQTYIALSDSSFTGHRELVDNRETYCGLRVETGGFVFAIINAIIVTAGTLFCLNFFWMMLKTRLNPDEMKDQETIISFLTTLSVVCLVGAAIAEVFAVLLCVGISKKKPRFVLSYLVFGITTEILSVTGIVCFIWVSWGQWDLVIYSAALLGICGIYVLPLLLLKQTYIALLNSSPIDNRRLINNQRPCFSRETCCGMRVETGGFLFAIINAIIVTAGTLCCICFFGMMLKIRLDPNKMWEQKMNSSSSFLTILSVVCLVGAAVAEVFAVLLCVGISKKKPRFIMAYLLYGILTEILSVIGIVCYICLTWGEWHLVICGASLLGVCCIYALPLLLVRQAYIVLFDPSFLDQGVLLNNQDDF